MSYDEYEKVKTRNKELEGQVAKLQEELDAVVEKPKSQQREKADKGSSADSGKSSKKG